eukprot:8020230-Pyramimonas_sp.AAC.1
MKWRRRRRRRRKRRSEGRGPAPGGVYPSSRGLRGDPAATHECRCPGRPGAAPATRTATVA